MIQQHIISSIFNYEIQPNSPFVIKGVPINKKLGSKILKRLEMVPELKMILKRFSICSKTIFKNPRPPPKRNENIKTN